MDFINELREAQITSAPVNLEEGKVTIGSTEYENHIKTPVRAKTGFLTVEELALALLAKDRPSYIRSAVSRKIKPLDIATTVTLRDYFSGKTSSLSLIDTAGLSADAQEPPGKRQKLYSDEAVKVKSRSEWTVEDILRNEDVYLGRDAVLAAPKSFESVIDLYDRVHRAMARVPSRPPRPDAASGRRQSSRRSSSSSDRPSSVTAPASAAPSLPQQSAAHTRPLAAAHAGPHLDKPHLGPSGPRPGERRPSSSSLASSQRPASSTHKRPRPDAHPPAHNDRTPIIIVPSAVSSLITLQNASKFLGDGLFVHPDEERKSRPRTPVFDPTGARRDAAKVYFDRKSRLDPRKVARFQVIDDVKTLRGSDWKRVVAAFATGANWQFTNWPIGRTPASIFNRICGFHLHYDDEPLNPNIKQWRVHKLAISKTKRYQDMSLVMDFWQILGDFIAANPDKKNRLFY